MLVLLCLVYLLGIPSMVELWISFSKAISHVLYWGLLLYVYNVCDQMTIFTKLLIAQFIRKLNYSVFTCSNVLINIIQYRYGQGSGTIHITDLECSSNNIHILHCTVRSDRQCEHSSDVAVICCKFH